MELNDFNESYKKQSSKTKRLDTEKTKNTIESMKRQMVELTDAIEDLNIKRTRAERDKNAAGVKSADQDLKAKKAELKKLQTNLTRLEDTLQKARTTVDNYLEQVGELAKTNPELQAQLDSAIKTKFERALARNKSEKEKLQKQIAPLQIIRDAANKNPNVMYSIMTIEKNTKSIKEQEAILADPNKSDAEKSNATSALNSAKSAIEAHRNNLAKYFKGKVSREDINRITSLSALDQEIKSGNRKIKSLDKQNANYETAIQNIGDKTQEQTQDPGKTSILNRLRPGQGAQPVQPGQGTAPATSGVPATKPKWWQFIKRFKNWYHKDDATKAPAEPAESTDPTQPLGDKNAFKDSMKYDVVRDYKDKLAEQYLKDAKAQNKAAKEAADKEAAEKDGPEL